jgi:hypothetical protein
MAEIHEGGCLCGTVRYRLEGDPVQGPAVCHCTFCKRRTGSAFGLGAYFDESAVRFTTGVLKTYAYRSDETGRWLKTEFCPNCGTTVAWTGEWAPGQRGIALGTFDDPNWIKPRMQVFARSALSWAILPADVEAFETLPPVDVAS